MTDATAAPGLHDVWTLLLDVVGRQPIQIQVLIVLGALLLLVLVLDGIRANVRRRPRHLPLYEEKPAAAPAKAKNAPFTPPIAKLAAPATRSATSRKRVVHEVRRHKAPRPVINRVPPEIPALHTVYQPTDTDFPRE